MQEVVPLLVTSGIEATRSEEKRGTVIDLRKSPTVNATDATLDENPTGKAYTGGNTAPSDAAADATNGPDATPNPADRAEGGIGGNSGIRNGGFSGPASFDAKPGEDVRVMELEARRATISSEEGRRVRKLVRERMAEEWSGRFARYWPRTTRSTANVGYADEAVPTSRHHLHPRRL